jgi:hypothetical protein
MALDSKTFDTYAQRVESDDLSPAGLEQEIMLAQRDLRRARWWLSVVVAALAVGAAVEGLLSLAAHDPFGAATALKLALLGAVPMLLTKLFLGLLRT